MTNCMHKRMNRYATSEEALNHIKAVFLKSYFTRSFAIIFTQCCLIYVLLLLYRMGLVSVVFPSMLMPLFFVTYPVATYLTTKKFNTLLKIRKRGKTAYIYRGSPGGKSHDTPKKNQRIIREATIVNTIIGVLISLFVNSAIPIYPAFMLIIFIPCLTAGMAIFSCYIFFRYTALSRTAVFNKTQHQQTQDRDPFAYLTDPNDARNPVGTSYPWSPNAPLSMSKQDRSDDTHQRY